MNFKYQIAGLNLLSDLEIPVLKKKEFSQPDITIKIKLNIQSPKNNFQILDANSISYKDKHGNIFLINKSNISICIKNKKINEASNSILGIPIGFLLQKNHFQVIHGSSIAYENSAICFFGKSTAGKSSMAASLVERDFKLVTEDLCIIKNTSIFNFSDWIKSSENTFPKKIDFKKRIPIKNDSRNRMHFKLDDEHISQEKANIKAVYFLNNSKRRSIKKLGKADSFKYLFSYAYRTNDADIESFKKLSMILKNIDCYLFSRNIEMPLKDNSEFIFNHLNKNYFK